MSTAQKWWKRWEFLGAQDLGDDPYLGRLRILVTPWFGVYLHHIQRDDGNRLAHDHPWWFWSLLLHGGYREVYYPDKTNPERFEYRTHRRGASHSMGTQAAHSILHLQRPVWTLFVTGPPTNTKWGFWEDGYKTPWQEYEGRENVAAGWPSWKREGELRSEEQ